MTDEDLQRAFAEVHRHFDAALERVSLEAKEIRHHFDLVLEEIRSEIQQIAEGHITTDQRLTREVVRLDERIDAGAEEATALRFAHNKLDARVGVLEEKKRTRR